MKNQNRTPELFKLPKIRDYRGNLSFIESNNHIPFNIERVYWLHDIKVDSRRGGYMFKKQNSFLINLSGSSEFNLIHNNENYHFLLNRPYLGLFIPNNTWIEFNIHSTNTFLLVFADTSYDPDDYIRDKLRT